MQVLPQWLFFYPSQTTQRYSKPTGYIVTPPSCQTRQTCQTGQTQASRPRNTHTAVAIKQAKHYPCGNSSLEPNHTAACKPTGYIVTHQLVRQVRQVRQVRHKRHAAATCTPPQPSSCPAYPCGKSSPEPNHTAACKPSGYHMTPPSSFYKSYKSYKSYASVTPRNTHTAAAIKLPGIPHRQLFARAIPNCGKQKLTVR